MTKEDFIERGTEIISDLLDNLDENGVHERSKCLRKLGWLFDRIMIEGDKTANWYPCKVCQNQIEYFPPDRTPKHWVECNTCGYAMFFDVDVSSEEAKKFWNKLMR